MTNSSPPDSQNPIPERRTRPAAGVTFDEMIAIIVAFSTIGAILFWSLGGRRSRIAGINIGDSNLSSDHLTTIGIGNSLFGNTAQIDSDAVENRKLAAKLREAESPVAYVPPDAELNLPANIEKPSYRLDSGANLVPLAGVATLPTLRTNQGNTGIVVPEVEPGTAVIVPEEVETIPEPEAIEEPNEPIVPEETEMPEDVEPDYWAYPFVKQMRDRALVPEIAKNQSFEPDTLITRAAMATLISQAFDTRPLNENIKQFQDVTEQNAIAEDIDKAVRLGFMQGYSDNEFRPLENIPRYQVLVALATGLGLKPSQDAEQILERFTDSDGVPEWARQQVAAATEAGLVVNRPSFASDTLMPEETANRAEVAAMIHQALVKTNNLDPIESEYIINP